MKKLGQIIFLSAISGFGLYKGLELFNKKNKAHQLKLPFAESFSSNTLTKTEQKEWNFFRDLAIFAILLLVVWGSTTGFFQKYSHWLKSSIITQKHDTFDGTVFPVQKVPNWVALTNGERKMAYNQIPATKLIPIPKYDPAVFQLGRTWKPDNEIERNAYITYPVPNLGNYKLDGHEGAGSHTGVDVKLPIGTPISAFANGVVAKVEMQSTGFGYFVLLQHNDFPDPKNNGKPTRMYSLYAHLSQQAVKVGQVVKKGDLLGKSGNSGMATAPHLHFQLEYDTAPFHPYWPFTWSDIKAAGIGSYFAAVNAGLGREKAERYTMHPVNTHLAYQDYGLTLVKAVEEVSSDLVAMADTTSLDTENIPVTPTEPSAEKPLSINDAAVEIIQNPAVPEKSAEKIVTTTKKTSTGTIEIKTDRVFIPGREEIVEIHASEPASIGTLSLSSTLKQLAQISPTQLSANSFKNGVAQVRIKTETPRIFKIVVAGDFGTVKSSSIRPQIFQDVPVDHPEKDAISYLKENGIIRGYTDGTFKPDGTLSRAEAVKILVEANNIPLSRKSADFSDVAADAWYAPYVATAVEQGIVKGYPDGSFKPENQVTRAEFLKIATMTAQVALDNVPAANFPDVPVGEWFTAYFQLARQHDMIKPKKGGYAVPHTAITRGEAARTIWKIDAI